MTTITPFLWFHSGLDDAIARYREVFGDVEVHAHDDYVGGETGDADDSTLVVEFSVLGQRVIGMNAGPHFPQTEAFSFYVRCAGQDDVDRYWDGLIAGGQESQCGWLKDPWGVSWQICPRPSNGFSSARTARRRCAFSGRCSGCARSSSPTSRPPTPGSSARSGGSPCNPLGG